MDLENFLSQIEGKELYEWKSKKELENYLISEKRYGIIIIGYVTHKTLRKWNETIDWRGWNSDENMYVLQEGNDYYYLTFRALNKYLYKNKN